jgi:nitrogen fixation/metabolism regulation signal transduction histidine kinase
LAIVKRILEEHGGRLVLLDAPEGAGARVVLSFPAARIGVGESAALAVSKVRA